MVNDKYLALISLKFNFLTNSSINGSKILEQNMETLIYPSFFFIINFLAEIVETKIMKITNKVKTLC